MGFISSHLFVLTGMITLIFNAGSLSCSFDLNDMSAGRTCQDCWRISPPRSSIARLPLPSKR